MSFSPNAAGVRGLLIANGVVYFLQGLLGLKFLVLFAPGFQYVRIVDIWNSGRTCLGHAAIRHLLPGLRYWCRYRTTHRLCI